MNEQDKRTLFERIADEEMMIPSLTERNSDGLDFHEVHVRSVERALQRAFYAGKKAALDDTVTKLKEAIFTLSNG